MLWRVQIWVVAICITAVAVIISGVVGLLLPGIPYASGVTYPSVLVLAGVTARFWWTPKSVHVVYVQPASREQNKAPSRQ